MMDVTVELEGWEYELLESVADRELRTVENLVARMIRTVTEQEKYDQQQYSGVYEERA